jgi:acyl-CoA synthetase (AMP-forming)/AMP-acid ligase II
MIYLLSHSIINSAKNHPERPAFRFLSEEISYKQMAEKINQLANVLHENGLQKGDRVGIYLNRNLETAIAIYGILHAGGVYVPIDPKSPLDRCVFLLNDCNINILISENKLKRNLDSICKSSTSLNTIIGTEYKLGAST